MHTFAHRSIESARWVALAIVLAAAPAQDLAPVPPWSEVDAIAARALEAKDPMTRGEAALWLADSGRQEHRAAILATAKDAEAPARHRGILAVGRLGAPGCETFLGRLALESAIDSAEAAIAAFALGQLDDGVPTPAADTLLLRARSGSRKRHADVMAAFLAGLATRPHPRRATSILDLRDDVSNRSAHVFLLAQAALEQAGHQETRAQVTTWLTADQGPLRSMAVAAWRPDWRPAPAERELFLRLARGDADAAVRAAALRLLARFLDPRAVELADRALLSDAPVEAGAAAEVLLGLVGSARRANIEERMLDGRTTLGVQVALLDAFAPPLSPRALLFCHDAAHAASAPPELRVAAALALARADSVLAASALDTVFFATDDLAALSRLTAHLAAHDRLLAAADQLVKDATAPAAATAARLCALTRADPHAGASAFLRWTTSGHLRPPELGRALAAVRIARTQRTPAAQLQLLPPALAALLP